MKLIFLYLISFVASLQEPWMDNHLKSPIQYNCNNDVAIVYNTNL